MALRFLNIQAVLDRTSLSRTALYSRMADGTFPASIRLSVRRVAWVESEIEAWLQACIKGTPAA